jgi:two-component system response regulator FixJ
MAISVGRTVYVVDDDEGVRDSMRILLESCGMHVQDYGSARQFLDRGHNDSNACLILDIHMPGMSGLELLDVLREKGSGLPVIAITGRGDAPLRAQLARAGARAVFDKPVDDGALLKTIETVFGA